MDSESNKKPQTKCKAKSFGTLPSNCNDQSCIETGISGDERLKKGEIGKLSLAFDGISSDMICSKLQGKETIIKDANPKSEELLLELSKINLLDKISCRSYKIADFSSQISTLISLAKAITSADVIALKFYNPILSKYELYITNPDGQVVRQPISEKNVKHLLGSHNSAQSMEIEVNGYPLSLLVLKNKRSETMPNSIQTKVLELVKQAIILAVKQYEPQESTKKKRELLDHIRDISYGTNEQEIIRELVRSLRDVTNSETAAFYPNLRFKSQYLKIDQQIIVVPGETNAPEEPNLSDTLHEIIHKKKAILRRRYKEKNPQAETELLTPIEVEGETIGVIYLRKIKNGALTDEDLHNAIILSTITGTIIRKRLIEKREEEKRKYILHSQKMEAIGILTGGIAHDFNNVLSGALGFLELSLIESESMPSLHDKILAAYNTLLKASELAKQLLAFSKPKNTEKGPISIKAILEETVGLAKQTFPKMIEIKSNIERELPLISADPIQIHQALLNIMINAKEAIPPNQGGLIEVRATKADLREEAFAQIHHVKPDLYVKIDISDSGVGMDEETLQHIFEPFFTTKEKGSGLGLFTTYGIITNHGGYILAESEKGKGSKFTILLPCMKTEKKPPLSKTPPTDSVKRGKGTVLIIDDDDLVREATRGIVEVLGYEAIAAKDGPEGIEVLAKGEKRVDVAMIDIDMPKMRGTEVIEKIKDKCKVIVFSGGPEIECFEEFITLRKPANIEQISKALKEALDPHHPNILGK